MNPEEYPLPINGKPTHDAYNQRECDLNCFLYGYGMLLGLFLYRSGSDGERLCFTCCCSPGADALSCFPPVGLSCCTPPSDCIFSATTSSFVCHKVRRGSSKSLPVLSNIALL